MQFIYVYCMRVRTIVTIVVIITLIINNLQNIVPFMFIYNKSIIPFQHNLISATFYLHFWCMIELPASSYSFLSIHISWKVEREARQEPIMRKTLVCIHSCTQLDVKFMVLPSPDPWPEPALFFYSNVCYPTSHNRVQINIITVTVIMELTTTLSFWRKLTTIISLRCKSKRKYVLRCKCIGEHYAACVQVQRT